MALIKCSECGKEISSNVSSCPGCGNPINRETKVVTNRTSKKYKKPIILFLSIVLIFFGIALFVISAIYLYKAFERGGPGFYFYEVGIIAAFLFLSGITLASAGYGIAQKILKRRSGDPVT